MGVMQKIEKIIIIKENCSRAVQFIIQWQINKVRSFFYNKSIIRTRLFIMNDIFKFNL
jgi:uncharacterized protein (UPF0333 family)